MTRETKLINSIDADGWAGRAGVPSDEEEEGVVSDCGECCGGVGRNEKDGRDPQSTMRVRLTDPRSKIDYNHKKQ